MEEEAGRGGKARENTSAARGSVVRGKDEACCRGIEKARENAGTADENKKEEVDLFGRHGRGRGTIQALVLGIVAEAEHRYGVVIVVNFVNIVSLVPFPNGYVTERVIS